MRYDNPRALGLASVFAAPRFPGTEGEAAALDRMAHELRDAGWTVSYESRVGRVLPIRRTNALRAGMVAILLINAAHSIRQQHWSFPLLMAITVWIFITLAFQVGFIPYSDRSQPIQAVEAAAGTGTKRPRVVILTRVATPRRRLGGSRRWGVVGLVVALAAIVETLAWLSLHGWVQVGSIIAWIVLLAGLAILGFELMPNAGGPGPDDNRMGLALLAELARIWPKSARDRVDVRFIAVGGPRETVVEARENLIAPTLTIELVNPGLGAKISLGGTDDERAAAREAARDLWMPHLAKSRGLTPLRFRATPPPTLIVEGVREPRTLDDPAALGRAAQFVIEIALRWGKRQAMGADRINR